MQGNRVIFNFYYAGTLSADQTARFIAPCDLTIVSIKAVASNDSDATLKAGTTADDDGWFTAATIGDSNTVKTFDWGDWDGALVTSKQNPTLSKDGIALLTLDHDGSSGTAGQNVVITVEAMEG